MALNINFAKLELPDTPNWYLSCPKDMCPSGQKQSPIYSFSKAKLQSIVMTIVQDMPRTKILNQTSEGISIVQRTLLFRFPDYIDIAFFEQANHQSTLAIYSRSKYGHYDFKVNEKRVDAMLKEIGRLGHEGPKD